MATFQFKTILILAIVAPFFLVCGGGQKKATPPPQKQEAPKEETPMKAAPRAFSMEVSNESLANVTFTKGGVGYRYKDTGTGGNFSSWSGKNLQVLREVLDAAGDEYVLEITGHTDSRGPRTAEGEKMGNIWYSTQRAKDVYDSLIQAGVPAERMTYRGIADDQLLSGLRPKDQRHRRVTFKIVSKTDESEPPKAAN